VKKQTRVRVLEAWRNVISLQGRSVIVAMCLGQLGSLVPHVVVPSILAAFLIPEWRLSGAAGGPLSASAWMATGILPDPVALHWSRAKTAEP